MSGRALGHSESIRSGSTFLKNDVPEENLGRDGVEYFDGDDERFSDHAPVDKLLNEIFSKPSK